MRLRPLRSNDPREVAGYALQGLIGEGGQGAVFLGVSPSGERAAVKLLHASLTDDHDARRYFVRELTALQRVAPFCTARVLAADPMADPPYVVSEYVDGPSLQQVIREQGPLTGYALDRLAVATVTALGAVHAAGVVHRDFKPANVLLAADGPRVIDFGIARPLEATAATVSRVVGTPAYMAPEQLAGHAAGPPMDMFAWACTIAYAATGRPPFGVEPLPAVINRILHAEPDIGPLEGRLRDFVLASLAKDPGLRPTARQVLLGLMEDGRSGPSQPVPPPPPVSARPLLNGPPPPRVSGVTDPTPPPYPAGRTAPSRLSHIGPPGRPARRRTTAITSVAVAVIAAAATATAALLIHRPDTAVTTTSTSAPTASPTATVPPVAVVAKSPRLGVEFWQDGAPVAMSMTDDERPLTAVALRPGPVEMRFPTLTGERALQVCAWIDNTVTPIRGGGKVADHPCFRPGTGVADFEYGSATLYLNREGHNYLAGTRVAHQSDDQDKVLFSRIHRDGADTPLAQFSGTLYLTAFTDLDGDGVFRRSSPAEYEYFTLTFS
ncbi:serine/threonine-protein kinase [Spongiactinospora rosea]|uniref:serine/threonine-protein kinase n=1 Tax=Spongiactinospora rosea TaxID=2248750 RepID=UPI0013141E2F|nr:serine/threonine-protein kinase [Spongiactinospora rosea]